MLFHFQVVYKQYLVLFYYLISIDYLDNIILFLKSIVVRLDNQFEEFGS